MLTDNDRSDGCAYFSGDGSRIVFVADRDGDNEIFVRNADGSNPVRLTNNNHEARDPNW